MSPRARIGFSVAGLFVFAVVLFLVLFDGNWPRGPTKAPVSARLGRTGVAVGHLDIDPWSPGPGARRRGAPVALRRTRI